MKNYILFLFITIILLSCTTSNGNSTHNIKIKSKKIVNTVNDTIAKTLTEDRKKFEKLMQYAKSNNLQSLSMPEIEMAIAKQLLGIPYVAFTLENDSVEQLVVNFRALDCTTFVENIVALSISIKSNNMNFDNYCRILKQIRYRNGKINKYPSRLHYFTDWLIDNEKKGIIDIVSNNYGDANFDPTVYFMSKNHEKYKKLKNNPQFIDTIAKFEKQISAAKLKYFTPKGLKQNIDKVKNGDIIAFTTTLSGLDISHVAIAYFKNNNLHFYHASSNKKQVVLSENTIFDYLDKIKTNNGIILARISKY